MGRTKTWIGVLSGITGICICLGGSCKAGTALPDFLEGEAFVYDQLETGEGAALYTLVFTEKEYRLYEDNGIGVISQGTVSASQGKKLIFDAKRGKTVAGSYQGGAFEEPAVSLLVDGEIMEFVQDTDSGEDVYLSCLGVYEGETDGTKAVLILDRWREFYLYADGKLLRGSFDIYEGKTVEFASVDGEKLEGTVAEAGKGENGIFSVKNAVLSLEGTEFSYAGNPKTYRAEHAMGAYTLSLYAADVFTIRGADGFVKAMGTLSIGKERGEAVYFPRKITGDAEFGADFKVSFICGEEGFLFPD